MKILHVIDSSGLYGAEVVALNLMEAQEKLGLHPALLSIGDNGLGPKDIEIEAEKRGLECRQVVQGRRLFLTACASRLTMGISTEETGPKVKGNGSD